MKVILSFLSFSIICTQVWANRIEVKLKLSPTGQFEATTEQIMGQVKVVNGEVIAQSVQVPLNSLKTGIKLRDEHMKSKYLQVDRYPNAILHIGNGKGGKGTGELEIKGVKKSIQGKYKLEGNEIIAEFPIKLSDYNISGIRYMGVGVKDEALVKVKMAISP
jgi:polyisoprenoid-binding protein YceI